MKNYEKVVNGLEQCLNRAVECEGCPYEENCNTCMAMKADALALIKEMKAQLDATTPDPAACAPDYKAECDRLKKECCKLNDALCRVTMDYERVCADRAEMESELDSLRAVRATAEAFLGRKIEVI